MPFGECQQDRPVPHRRAAYLPMDRRILDILRSPDDAWDLHADILEWSGSLAKHERRDHQPDFGKVALLCPFLRVLEDVNIDLTMDGSIVEETLDLFWLVVVKDSV